MELDQLQAKIKASVWQAVAQSGIDLKSVPVDQQNQFIDAITENLMHTMDDLLDEVPKPEPTSPETVEGGKEIRGKDVHSCRWLNRTPLHQNASA
jgi:hypothetical protein